MKSKSIRLVWVIGFFIIILGLVGVVLYLKTDLFKTKEFLLKKYISQNIEDATSLFNFSKKVEQTQVLLNNDYIENAEISLKFIDDNENEEIFTIKEKGIINNSENSSYRKISCNYKEEDILNAELLKKNDIYGFRLTNLIKQFVSVENKNIPKLISTLGYNDKYFENKINLDNLNIFNIINFSEEEINKLKEEYVKLIFENLNKTNYSSNSNSLITLYNGESIDTKSYTLKVNKNEFDNIIKRIINKAISDEIILSKINKIEESLSKIGIKENNNLQNIYKTKLQEFYDSIDYNGEDEKKIAITVYEKDDKVLRVYIKTETMEYIIDKDTKKENAMSFKVVKLTNYGTDTKVFALANNENIEFKYENDNGNIIEVKYSDKNEDKKLNIIADIDYKSNKIKDLNIIINNQLDFSKKEKIKVSFENDKNILINKYDKQTINSITDSLGKIVINKIKESQEKVKSNTLENIVKFLDTERKEKLDERKEEFEEKKKIFNNKFELYEGEKIEYENIKKLLYVVGKNLQDYKITEDKKIKLYLEENKENTEKTNEILKVLKENDLYNVKMNYSADGMIESIDLTIYKEKQEV